VRKRAQAPYGSDDARNPEDGGHVQISGERSSPNSFSAFLITRIFVQSRRKNGMVQRTFDIEIAFVGPSI
jgi:hypothetical protein